MVNKYGDTTSVMLQSKALDEHGRNRQLLTVLILPWGSVTTTVFLTQPAFLVTMQDVQDGILKKFRPRIFYGNRTNCCCSLTSTLVCSSKDWHWNKLLNAHARTGAHCFSSTPYIATNECIPVYMALLLYGLGFVMPYIYVRTRCFIYGICVGVFVPFSTYQKQVYGDTRTCNRVTA